MRNRWLVFFCCFAPFLAHAQADGGACLRKCAKSLGHYRRSLRFVATFEVPSLSSELGNYLNELGQWEAWVESEIVDPPQALDRLREAGARISGYLVPQPWWDSLWVYGGLHLEESVRACAAPVGRQSLSKTELVQRARWAFASLPIDWSRVDPTNATPVLRLSVEIEKRLERALGKKPPDSLEVASALSGLRRLRYLLPLRATEPRSRALLAEDLLQSTLEESVFLVDENPVPSAIVPLTLPIYCWSQSISVTSGEERAKESLARACEASVREVDELRLGGASLRERLTLAPYTNISPWGRNPTKIPMVFDYFLITTATLSLQVDAKSHLRQGMGPRLQSETFENDPREGANTHNMAKALESWRTKCLKWLWSERLERKASWVVGTCGVPGYANGADYWKKTSVSSQPVFWYRD